MKKYLALFVVAACGLLLFAGCSSVEKKIRSVPPFAFETWAHSDRYGLFTDSISIAGAAWALNADGSATLTINQYDGQAAWAGTVGPHDTFSKLSVNFPAQSPQALTLAHLVQTKVELAK